MKQLLRIVCVVNLFVMVQLATADESVLGYVKGSETLPRGAWEYDQTLTYREGKGTGDYDAWDSKSELEYGVTDKFTVSAYLKAQSIDTQGILIDGYLPKDEIHEIEILSGAFMLMRKSTLDKVGLLDEDFFMYGEDI